LDAFFEDIVARVTKGDVKGFDLITSKVIFFG